MKGRIDTAGYQCKEEESPTTTSERMERYNNERVRQGKRCQERKVSANSIHLSALAYRCLS